LPSPVALARRRSAFDRRSPVEPGKLRFAHGSIARVRAPDLSTRPS
jgi:hypothetical protein